MAEATCILANQNEIKTKAAKDLNLLVRSVTYNFF